ncbi:hypothetical protein ACH5RR_023556 [Cinchona calisaya]|uniref:RNase H type-1 domain-containing protein n=1 Tax=Cinchona calisaya TaxID=153742 RepID=A0ABD2ZCI7_9GENT
MLEVGCRWRVGVGRNIQIWKDRWIPRPKEFKIITPPPNNTAIRTVEDLIDWENGGWRAELLEQLFCNEDVKDLAESWIQDMLITFDDDSKELPTVLLWVIWGNRNQNEFDGQLVLSDGNSCTLTNKQWKEKEDQWTQIQGGDGVSKLIRRPCEAVVAEALAAREAISFIREYCNGNFILEGDTSLVIQTLSSEDEDFYSIGHVLQRPKAVLQSCSCFEIQWVNDKGKQSSTDFPQKVNPALEAQPSTKATISEVLPEQLDAAEETCSLQTLAAVGDQSMGVDNPSTTILNDGTLPQPQTLASNILLNNNKPFFTMDPTAKTLNLDKFFTILVSLPIPKTQPVYDANPPPLNKSPHAKKPEETSLAEQTLEPFLVAINLFEFVTDDQSIVLLQKSHGAMLHDFESCMHEMHIHFRFMSFKSSQLLLASVGEDFTIFMVNNDEHFMSVKLTYTTWSQSFGQLSLMKNVFSKRNEHYGASILRKHTRSKVILSPGSLKLVSHFGGQLRLSSSSPEWPSQFPQPFPSLGPLRISRHSNDETRTEIAYNEPQSYVINHLFKVALAHEQHVFRREHMHQNLHSIFLIQAKSSTLRDQSGTNFCVTMKWHPNPLFPYRYDRRI